MTRSKGRTPDRRADRGPPAEARRDAQLFLAAPQTLGRPINVHLMDAFLRLCLYCPAGANQLKSGSNKRDPCVRLPPYEDAANQKMDPDWVKFRRTKGRRGNWRKPTPAWESCTQRGLGCNRRP